MMNLILRWLGGAAGPWIMVAVAAVIVALSGTILVLRVTVAHQETEIADLKTAHEKHLRQDAENESKSLTAARQREATHAAALDAATTKHLQEIDHEKHEADRILADERAGTLKLRQQFRACWNSISRPPASTGSGDGQAQGGLQRADIEFLVRLADDADVIVRQLGLAQSVIEADRQTCNGK